MTPGRLLFIDGDRTYQGVKSDFDMYSPLVRDGGLVGFHDIIPGPEEAVGGVPDFWDEIKQAGPFQELVDDWDLGSCGIGVVRVGDHRLSPDAGEVPRS